MCHIIVEISSYPAYELITMVDHHACVNDTVLALHTGIDSASKC